MDWDDGAMDLAWTGININCGWTMEHGFGHGLFFLLIC